LEKIRVWGCRLITFTRGGFIVYVCEHGSENFFINKSPDFVGNLIISNILRKILRRGIG
jgi:hypothetical protein